MDTVPPPDPPELPEGAERRPRWPAWYAGVGFLVGTTVSLVAIGVLAVAADVDAESPSAAFVALATLLQNAILIATALLFASLTARPRPWHFGLNRTAFWPAVGWASLGFFSFYFLTGLYSVLVQPETEQGITDSLGADEGTFGLIAAGVMVIAVAPVAEELFFRGFFYRALRTRFSVLVAALVDGVLFGAIHFNGEAQDPLLILPPLALLGFIFCLVYERTGSLFPVIALHAINNALAYGVQTDGDGTAVSIAVGVSMIAACAMAPRLLRPAPRAALA
jgi:membrane protease YdiL (CAAX protease family)